MSTQVSELVPAEAVPQIIVTEPSPASQKGSVVVSIADKAVPAPEQSTKVPQAAVLVEAESNLPHSSDSSDVEVISEEFASAQECAECTVPVPETESHPVEALVPSDSSETYQDDFRIPSTTSMYGSCLSCLACYEGFCDRISYRWRIPLWLILFGLPLSAGVISSIYMMNCPGAINLPHAAFITAIAGVALVTARLCSVLHKITGDEEGETKQNLRIFVFIATFVFLLFFFLESLIYWQVDWTSRMGAKNYCHPTLMNFMFVWNIVMYVALVPILFFPA